MYEYSAFEMGKYDWVTGGQLKQLNEVARQGWRICGTIDTVVLLERSTEKVASPEALDSVSASARRLNLARKLYETMIHCEGVAGLPSEKATTFIGNVLVHLDVEGFLRH